jgi:hypothetical protein
MMRTLGRLFGKLLASKPKATPTSTKNPPTEEAVFTLIDEPTISAPDNNPKWSGKQTSNCPVCDIETIAHIPVDTELEPYLYNDDVKLIANSVCPFCKSRIAMVADRQGNLIANDKKWDADLYEYDKKLTMMQVEISDLEDDLEETESETKIASIEKKIDALNVKIERHEETFAIKEDKYNDRCAVLAFKAAEKYDQIY